MAYQPARIDAGWSASAEHDACIQRTRGFTAADDNLPPKMFVPLTGGATDGVAITPEEFASARALYYELAGWDSEGRPTAGRLRQLDLDWLVD